MRLRSACIALPALVALAFLLVVSAFVYGHVLRPGLYAELLLVLYLSALLLHFQHHKLRGAIVNTLLLLIFYGACLAKYLILGEGLSWSDLAGVGDLFFVLPAFERVAAVAMLGIPLVGLLTNLTRPRLLPAVLLLAPLTAYLVGTVFAPASVHELFEAVRPTSLIVELESWRDGPLLVVARQPPRERTILQYLATAPASDDVDVLRRAKVVAALPSPRRSVHVIILESFVDPTHFRALDCPSDPVDPRFRRWIDESESLALSATFGGKSARTEFEVLCGVPSFERLGVDFMALRGAALPCLPNLLRQHGYVTISNSSGPASFFNHDVAHRALGFEQPHFGADLVMTEADMDGEFISDEIYYSQLAKWVLPVVKERRPLFNYILTWAGHYPFDLNPQRHPPLCADDKIAGKVANAAHYASIAVADYVELIEAHDPEALILVLADHLPVLGLSGAGYREADYQLAFHGRELPPFWAASNPAWLESRATTLVVRMARQPVSLGLIPHHLIPEAILDLLSDGAYCRATECLRALPIIDRPQGARPVFTTPELFPSSICASESDAGDPLCRRGMRLHGKLVAEYDALLRAGLQVETLKGTDE
jgi:phosphoglycerol transferase MdoB-like AlkP superfamily enzyme